MSLSNATSSQQEKFNQLFHHTNKPPRGFEALAQEQKIVIDVYYLDRFVGVTDMIINANTIQFTRPKGVLGKINDLKNADEVLAKMLKPMKKNSHLVCNHHLPQHCNQLFTQTVGVIYDPDSFRINLFIHPRYLNNPHSVQWLEPSTAGLSYLNNVYMAADSGSRNFPFINVNNSSNNYFNSIINQPLFNMTSANTLAYGNTRLNLSASLANRDSFETIFNANEIQLNNANIAHTYNNYEYTAGLIELPSTIFFASNAILGAEVKSTLHTLQDKSVYLATPIRLFLPLAATVSLLQGSRIIYSAKLPAGSQTINTSAFPQGSYPVTVRINDVQGGTSIETKMVSNSVLLAPVNMPQHYFSMGYLMGVRQLNSNVYDRFLPIPVYQAGTNYRLRDNMGVNFKVLGTSKAAFFNPGVTLIGRDYIFQPGVLFTSDQRYGYTNTFNWQKNKWSVNYNISQILYSGNPQQNYCFRNEPTSCALSLLNQGTFYSSVSVGYGFPLGNIGIFGSESNYYESQKLYTYGVNVTTALRQSSSGSWQLNVNASRSQYENNVFATITYNFNSANTAGTVGMGYGHFQTNYYPANKSESQNGLTTQGNVIWHKTDTTNNGYTVGLQGNTDPLNKTIGATYDVNKAGFHANSYVTSYINNAGTYAQYGGVFNSRYVWAQQKMAVGNGFMDDNAGALIRVNAPDSQASFDVYADDKVVLHIHANHNYLLKLDAYKKWRINLSDTSKNLYHFDNRERTIVLYPGNVETIIWSAEKVIALGGMVVDTRNEPVRNAVIDGGLGFAMTDGEGYFQVRINEHVKLLTIRSSTQTCSATLPALDVKQNVAYIEKMICH